MENENEFQKQDSVTSESSLNRRKKSPEEIALEGEEDEFTSKPLVNRLTTATRCWLLHVKQPHPPRLHV